MSENRVGPAASFESDPGRYALLDHLAAEFAGRYRKGERPSLKEYIDRHPDLADEIRELFPALVEIEGVDEPRDGVDRPAPTIAAPPPFEVGGFQIVREVGRGGMGVVYEALQLSLGRRVALKVLPRLMIGDGRAVERFRREARAAARLHHSHIVPVFEVGQDGDVLYYAMQFIQGQGLDLVVQELKRLRDRSRGSPGGVAAVAEQRPGLDDAPHWDDWPAGDRTLLATASGGEPRASQLAFGLLTGRIAAEPERTAAWERPAPDPDATGLRIAPIATAPPDPRPSGSSATSFGSAVLPGGAPISSVDALGKPMALYRSVAQIGRQAAEALGFAHARGIVHRDIKPSNLLLDTAGVVWIADFGLAKGEDEGLTHTGDVIGTIRYMAPERFRGEGDARADVYALGLTLYELLALQPAFHSSDRLRLIEMIRSEEPARPRAIDPRIPRDLETIVLKAIEKDPKRRYGTAGALAEDLRRFQEGEAIQARSVTSFERVVKWARRRPHLAALFASTGVLVLALLGVWTNSYIKIHGALSESRFQQQKAELSERRAVAEGARAEDARATADAAALDARRQAARSMAQDAQAAAESGSVERGVFGLADALALAPDRTPDDAAVRLAMRRGIAAWRAAAPVLRHAFDDADGGGFVGPGGMTLAVFHGARLRLIDLPTGREIGEPGGVEFPAPIFAISPDGAVVIVGGLKAPAQVFERETRRRLAVFPEVGDWNIQNRATMFGPANRYFLRCGNVADGGAAVQCWRLDGKVGPVGPRRTLVYNKSSLDHSCALLPARGGHTVLAQLPDEASAGVGSREPVRFWDLDAGREVAGIEIEPGAQGRDWAFRGSLLVTASVEGLVRWWDPATGRPARRPWWPERAMCNPALIDGGRVLAVGCDDRRVRWFDLDRREPCAPAAWAAIGPKSELSVAPGGMFFLVRNGRTLGVWQCPGPLDPAPSDDAGHASVSYNHIDFRPDRAAYVLGQPSRDGVPMNWPNRTARERVPLTRRAAGSVHDVATGRPIGPPLYPWTRYPTYSRDGRLIAAARSTWERHGVEQMVLVGVWEAGSGRVVLPLRSVRAYVHSLAFSPDGRTLAVGMVPGIELFDLTTGGRLGFLEQSGPISRLEFRPDGRVLAAGRRGGWGNEPGVRLWDPAILRPAGPILPCKALPYFRFDADGTSLMVLDFGARRLTRLDGTTGTPLAPPRELVERPTSEARGRVEGAEASEGDPAYDRSPAIAMRPDGRALAEALRAEVVLQWGVDDGRPIGPPLVHPVAVMAIAYSPDGATLACGGIDGVVRLWDAQSGLMIGPPLRHGGLLLGLSFAPDGRNLVVVTRDGKATTWPLAPAPPDEDPDRLRDRGERSLGFARRDDGTMSRLSAEGWRLRGDRLASEGSADDGPDSPREMLIAWHRDRARELERAGDPLEAGRHLDALASLCPDDWTPIARQAAALADAGRPGAADAEYARAARVAPPRALTDWYWRQALSRFDVDSQPSRLDPDQLERALWYMDKVVAARPDDWQSWVHRADVLDRLGRHDRREADEDRALAAGAGPMIAFDYAADAVAHDRPARAGRLLSDFSDALDRECREASGPLTESRATLLVHLGDTPAFHRFCRLLVEPGSNASLSSVASAFAVGPVTPDVAERAVEGFEQAAPRVLAAVKPIFLSLSGIVLYRAARHADAIRSFEEANRLGAHGNPESWAFLAMSHRALGHDARARDCLAEFERLRVRAAERHDFWDDLRLDHLRREAEARIRFDPAFPESPFAGP
jgi:serine/threonine protein kinase/WD40 repeat protein